MKTKRAPRKATQPTAISAATKTSPAAAIPDIPRTHELIVDAVTEILTHGGHRDDVDSLLSTAMGHTRRRTFGRLVDPAEAEKLVNRFIHEEFENWKADLAIAWRKNERPELPAFEAKTISERIRANVRERVLDGFGSFMAQSSPEEQRFLLDAFEIWESSHLPAENGSDEIVLGDAFEFALGNNSTYVKVPRRMFGQVQKYVDALRAVEDKAA